MASTCPECKKPLPPERVGKPGKPRVYCGQRCYDRVKGRKYRKQATEFRALRKIMAG